MRMQGGRVGNVMQPNELMNLNFWRGGGLVINYFRRRGMLIKF